MSNESITDDSDFKVITDDSEFKVIDNIPYYVPVIDDFHNFIELKNENIDPVVVHTDGSHTECTVPNAESLIDHALSNNMEHESNHNVTALAIDTKHTDIRQPRSAVHALINGKSITMEFDSGSTVSVCFSNFSVRF